MSDRPLRADARRNRERVLAAAREAFAESGFSVPLDEIAVRAGVGPGTVYRHFPTKEALFEAVALVRVHDLTADARARASASDPRVAFEGFLELLAGEASVKRDLPDALDGAGADTVAARDEMRDALDVLLRRAQDAGAVRADVDIADLFALLKGLIHSVRASDDPDLVQRLLHVVRDGLRAPSPPERESTFRAR
jgi:AcrR family transcriptional regulator